MIELILSFTASIAIGYLLSRMSAFPVLRRLTDISTTIVIYLLLFLLGAQTGSNEEVLSNLAAIGLDALLLALAGTVGSAFAAWLLYRYHRDFSLKAVESSTDNRNRSFSFGTLCSLVALILGVISGKSGIAAPLLGLKLDLAMVLLYILLISVGLGIGLKPGLGDNGIALQYLQGTYCFDIHSIFSEEAGSVCSCCGSRCHFYGRLPARNHKELRA